MAPSGVARSSPVTVAGVAKERVVGASASVTSLATEGTGVVGSLGTGVVDEIDARALTESLASATVVRAGVVPGATVVETKEFGGVGVCVAVVSKAAPRVEC